MHLLGLEPAHAPHFRVQVREELSNGLRKLEADEKPFRVHWRLPNSLPERDGSLSEPAVRNIA